MQITQWENNSVGECTGFAGFQSKTNKQTNKKSTPLLSLGIPFMFPISLVST